MKKFKFSKLTPNLRTIIQKKNTVNFSYITRKIFKLILKWAIYVDKEDPNITHEHNIKIYIKIDSLH